MKKKKDIATHQNKKFGDKKFFGTWTNFVLEIYPIYKWRNQIISYSIFQIPKKSIHIPRFLACRISSSEIFIMLHQSGINRHCYTISLIMISRFKKTTINLTAFLQPRCVQIKFQRYVLMNQILCINLQKSPEYEKAPQLFSMTSPRLCFFVL